MIIAAISRTELCSTSLEAKSSITFMPSFQLSSSQCGNLHTIKIKANSGQNINLTALRLHNGHSEGSYASLGVVVVDDISHQQFPLGFDGQTAPLILSHSISLLLDNTYGQPPFVVGYKGKH